MANTKKTYMENTETKDTEAVAVVEQEEKPAKTTRKKKTFENTDLIDCKSMIHGALYMKGRNTGQVYYWAGINDVIGVEYRDLVSEVRNSSSKFVYAPRFYITNEDFLSEFPKLKEFYESLYTENDFRNILNMSVRDMTAAIKELPDSAKERLKAYVGFQMGNGSLDSLSKIRALDEIFGTNLSFVSSMNG